MSQFVEIVVPVNSENVTFVPETLTPQETHLRADLDLPVSELPTIKVGFSSPNQGRPNSYSLTRVYKTPVTDDEGKVIGVIRTDIKETVITAAGPQVRSNHFDMVQGVEASDGIKTMRKDLKSWY